MEGGLGAVEESVFKLQVRLVDHCWTENAHPRICLGIPNQRIVPRKILKTCVVPIQG